MYTTVAMQSFSLLQWGDRIFGHDPLHPFSPIHASVYDVGSSNPLIAVMFLRISEVPPWMVYPGENR